MLAIRFAAIAAPISDRRFAPARVCRIGINSALLLGVFSLWTRRFLRLSQLAERQRWSTGWQPANPRRHVGNRVAAGSRRSRDQVRNEKQEYQTTFHRYQRSGPTRGESSERHAPGLTIPLAR